MKHKSTVAALVAIAALTWPMGATAQQDGLVPEDEPVWTDDAPVPGAGAGIEPGTAPTSRSSELLDELARADAEEAARLEREIRMEWSRSGSAAMDLLLKRGRDALEVGDVDKAIGHFTALTDHAPDFAEGWHALALAYYQDDRLGLTADALERTLALNPQHFGALRGLATLLDKLDRPALAYDAYSRVLEIRPHDADVQAAIERLSISVEGTRL